MTDAKAKGQMPRPGDQPQVRAHPVAHLLGVLYQHAAPAERSRLIEVLMRPLSLLCLAAVSGGVFTAIRLRSGWAECIEHVSWCGAALGETAGSPKQASVSFALTPIGDPGCQLLGIHGRRVSSATRGGDWARVEEVP